MSLGTLIMNEYKPIFFHAEHLDHHAFSP